MKKEALVTIIGIFLAVLSMSVWAISTLQKISTSHPTESSTNPVIEDTGVVFISPQTQESVSVVFATSTAIFTGLGFDAIVFTPMEAASGAQYINTESNLVLWNKGEEITVSRGREVLFVGEQEVSVDPNQMIQPFEVTATTTATSTLQLLSTTTPEQSTSTDAMTEDQEQQGVEEVVN